MQRPGQPARQMPANRSNQGVYMVLKRPRQRTDADTPRVVYFKLRPVKGMLAS
jgi:hypothetical protein